MSAGDLQGIVDWLPSDWAGRRITVEWSDCQKHEGCEPEWMASAETLSDDRIIASATGKSMVEAIRNLESTLRDAWDQANRGAPQASGSVGPS